MIDHINGILKAQREHRFSESPQLSLGELINELDKSGLMDNGAPKSVEFDFGSAVPTTLSSWRGSYEELALGYKLSGHDNDEEHFSNSKADELVQNLKSAIGTSFYGWKGGNFTMTEDTPIWIANPVNSGNTAIIGVLDCGWKIVILTGYQEF